MEINLLLQKSISDSKLKCENDNKKINEMIKELTNKCDEVKVSDIFH